MQQRQPDVVVAEGIGEAQQVVDHQQRQRTEQRAEQVGRFRLLNQAGFIDGLEPGHDRVGGLQADIGFAGLAVIGQGKKIGARRQWP